MAFIIYATLFRLAVIAAGIACVFMGFRLFVLGVMPKDGSEIDAAAGEIRLTLRNAAPGTCFALFGAVIIGIMLWQGNPEMRRSEVTGSGAQIDVVWRGEDDNRFEASIRRAETLEEDGSLEDAIKAYAEALSNPSLTLEAAARPLIGLARIYHRQKRHSEALSYAQLVYQFQNNDPAVLVLMAQIERDQGDLDTAIQMMQRAVNLKPELRPKLVKLRELHSNE